jgi:hypothetical protein
MNLTRTVVVAGCIWTAACASAIVRPAAAPARQPADALLVLPGFGYGNGGEQAFRSLAPTIAADGIDLYLPTYISRSGLEESRARLRRFIRENRLARYERVHVFTFIAGGWTFNSLADDNELPNLATVIYDRSPYQERAPRIALERLRLLTWLKYGTVVFDVARTPYSPLAARDIRVGLVVETMPTRFIKRFAADAAKQGPYQFECGAFAQRFDDCFYVAMNHNQLYTRFGDMWPEVRSFIRAGHFTPAANRTPPRVTQELQ